MSVLKITCEGWPRHTRLNHGLLLTFGTCATNRSHEIDDMSMRIISNKHKSSNMSGSQGQAPWRQTQRLDKIETRICRKSDLNSFIKTLSVFRHAGHTLLCRGQANHDNTLAGPPCKPKQAMQTLHPSLRPVLGGWKALYCSAGGTVPRRAPNLCKYFPEMLETAANKDRSE